jgi:hypothetical protein
VAGLHQPGGLQCEIASRTTVRLTPCISMMTDSVGSFSPGFRVPAWMLLVKLSTTPWARLRCFFLGGATAAGVAI